jgi:energy-coupling factor transporter ATP-binding protein EcfA2
VIVRVNGKLKAYQWLEEAQKAELDLLVEVEKNLKSFFESVEVCFKSGNFNNLTPVDPVTSKGVIQKLKQVLEDKIKEMDEAAFSKKLADAKSQVTNLKHKKKLTELSEGIRRYIFDLDWNLKASEAAKTINTKPITDKQKKIFEEYFTKQYRQLFFQEASKLQVNFQIDVKPKGSAGKTLRKLDVLSYSPADVLSEGEQRAIALADFLTEIEICGIKGGLVFDDPVNSMDHERKSYIARRLVAESIKRQVIIFTHDISFLFDLVNEAERHKLKEKQDFYCHWVQKIENNVGVVHINHRKELELDYKTHTRAEECWQSARAESDPVKRESLSRQGFDCLRKTYEAFILTEIFGDTVKRFDRRIRYDTLKQVYCTKEVSEFVSDRLGYCSGFVSAHLPTDAYSGESPNPELLKREIDVFVAFRAKFREEKKQLLN